MHSIGLGARFAGNFASLSYIQMQLDMQYYISFIPVLPFCNIFDNPGIAVPVACLCPPASGWMRLAFIPFEAGQAGPPHITY